jgi:hypothetical protein
MITWLFKHRRACATLVAFAASMDPLALGAAYLPLVGPPPLRFEKTVVVAKTSSWTPAVLTPSTFAVETNYPSVTSSIPANNVIPLPSATEPVKMPVPPPTDNLSTNSTDRTHSANDLLVVTPEMLVDYFKPNKNATNASDVRVLVPVNFTPPASVSIPSSQASYISP